MYLRALSEGIVEYERTFWGIVVYESVPFMVCPCRHSEGVQTSNHPKGTLEVVDWSTDVAISSTEPLFLSTERQDVHLTSSCTGDPGLRT